MRPGTRPSPPTEALDQGTASNQIVSLYPDGTRLAFTRVKVLDVPSSVNGPAGLRWAPQGRAVTYIDTINGVSNIWSLPLDGGKPVQLTDFKTDQIFWFDFSRDGKLAVSRGKQTSDVILIRDFR